MKNERYDDPITESALRAAMGAQASRFTPHVFSVVDSTNTEAKRRAAEGERFALLVAESQTAGRGRMGRSFYSPNGTGVYFSVLYTVRDPLSGVVSITSAAAVAVRRAILRTCGIETEIKWVNDLIYRGKKVCGILAESVARIDESGACSIVIGIGINLRSAAFPSELAGIAGTLENQTVDRAALVAAVLDELVPFLDNGADRSWVEDYRRYSCVIGRPITWRSGESLCAGVAVDVDEDGALLVRDQEGREHRLATGEISVRLQEG